MPVLALILLSILIVSCEKSENPVQIPPPAGLNLSHLPTADYCKQLGEMDPGFVEILISGDRSEVFHQGKSIANTSTEKELFSAIQQAGEENDKLGKETPLLISAPASTPFRIIRERIRTAAETGIYKIHFLVSLEQRKNSGGIVSIELPCMDQRHSMIEPYFLQITREGRIFSGTGSSRSPMDHSNTDRQIIELSGNLELYSAAARAAGIPDPLCQIYVNPEATYQRAIDLVSLTTSHNIKTFFTDMLPEPKSRPTGNPPRKPTPPNIKPLRIAPKK